MAVVKGTAMWASLHRPNTTYDPEYKIDVIVDKENADKIKELGMKLKKTDDGDLFVSLKRSVETPQGEKLDPPKVMDTKKRPIVEDVGNGSAVIVQFKPYEWKYKNRSGVSGDLQQVMVTRLIPYVGGNVDELEVLDEETEILDPVTKDDNSDSDNPFDDE